jgi:ELWxxDGT repeat protein
LTVAGGLLHFVAEDRVHGTELWQSDGTADGTVIVADLADGDSDPRTLVAVGDRLLFGAVSRDHGSAFFTVVPEVGGDYTRDGRVDGADFLAWQRGVGTTVAVPGDGADGNDNGGVDRTDLVIWENNFGRDFAAAADYDQNGRTDGSDLLAWQRAVGGTSGTADGDRDGHVGSGDLDLLLSLLGGGVGAEGAGARGAAAAAHSPRGGSAPDGQRARMASDSRDAAKQQNRDAGDDADSAGGDSHVAWNRKGLVESAEGESAGAERSALDGVFHAAGQAMVAAVVVDF